MEAATFPAESVRRLSQGYVCLKFEFSEHQAFIERYQANGTPMILFLSADGKLLEKISGFHTPAELTLKMKRHLR